MTTVKATIRGVEFEISLGTETAVLKSTVTGVSTMYKRRHDGVWFRYDKKTVFNSGSVGAEIEAIYQRNLQSARKDDALPRPKGTKRRVKSSKTEVQ